MKMIAISVVALSALVGAGSAQAGCLSGAAAGGVAGHFAGHHAVLGALAGCAVGHHMAAKRRHMQEQQPANQAPDQGNT